MEAAEQVRLEHRLTKIEEAVVASTSAMTDLATHVKAQNGRIGKLETWRTQQGTLVALALAAGPFVFWALSKWV